MGLDAFAVTISDGQGGSVDGDITVFISDSDPHEANAAQVAIQPDGGIALLFRVEPGQPSIVLRSVDLESWSALHEATADADGLIPFLDNGPLNRYFYRVVPQ